MRKGFIQELKRGVIDYHESERRSRREMNEDLRRKQSPILGRRKRYGYKTIGTALQTPNTKDLRQSRIFGRKDKVSRTRTLRKNIQQVDPILFSLVPGLPLTPPWKWAWNPGGKRESPVLLAGACSE